MSDNCKAFPGEQQVVPGISINSHGQATVSAAMKELLFDLSLVLEDRIKQPVDIQHVVAALVLGSRNREINSREPIAIKDDELLRVLSKYTTLIFSQTNGRVSKDE